MDVYKRWQSKSQKTWHSFTFEAFFEYMYKVCIIQPISHFISICFVICSWLITLFICLCFPIAFHMQCEISIIKDVAIKHKNIYISFCLWGILWRGWVLSNQAQRTYEKGNGTSQEGHYFAFYNSRRNQSFYNWFLRLVFSYKWYLWLYFL